MIVTKYQSRKFDPARSYRRYVRKDAMGDGYSWCLTSERGKYDVAQGTCESADIPSDVKRLADARRGEVFGYVIWPEAGE